MASSYPNNYGNMKEDRVPVVPQEVTICVPDSPSYVSVAEPEKQWSPAGLIVSIVSYFCCCLPGHICGFIGVIMSVLSYSDHRSKNFVGAEHKRKWALGCGITAMIVGAIIIIVFIALYATGVSMVMTQMHAIQHENNVHLNNDFRDEVDEMRHETDHLQDRAEDMQHNIPDNWQNNLDELYQKIGDRMPKRTTKRPDYFY